MNKSGLNLFAYEHDLITLDDLLLDMDNHDFDAYEAANDDNYDAVTSGYESNIVLN